MQTVQFSCHPSAWQRHRGNRTTIRAYRPHFSAPVMPWIFFTLLLRSLCHAPYFAPLICVIQNILLENRVKAWEWGFLNHVFWRPKKAMGSLAFPWRPFWERMGCVVLVCRDSGRLKFSDCFANVLEFVVIPNFGWKGRLHSCGGGDGHRNSQGPLICWGVDYCGLSRAAEQTDKVSIERKPCWQG